MRSQFNSIQNDEETPSPKKSQQNFTREELTQPSLGLDWFSFQTQIRKLVLELIEPTIKRTMEDHELVAELNISYEKLKLKVEEFEFDTTKSLNRTVTHEDLAKKQQEMDKQRLKSEEKIWAEISKQGASFDYLRDKVTQFLQEAHTFNKLHESIQMDVKDMERTVDNIKADLHKDIMRLHKDLHAGTLELNQKLGAQADQLKQFKSHIDNFNQVVQREQVEVQKFNFKLDDMLFQANENTQRALIILQKDFEQRVMSMKSDILHESRLQIVSVEQKIMQEIMGTDGTNQDESQLQEEYKDGQQHDNEVQYDNEGGIDYKGSESFQEEEQVKIDKLDITAPSKDTMLHLNDSNNQESPQPNTYQEIKLSLQQESLQFQNHTTKHKSQPFQSPDNKIQSYSPENTIFQKQITRKQTKVDNPISKKQMLSLDQIWQYVQEQFEVYVEDQIIDKVVERVKQEMDQQNTIIDQVNDRESHNVQADIKTTTLKKQESMVDKQPVTQMRSSGGFNIQNQLSSTDQSQNNISKQYIQNEVKQQLKSQIQSILRDYESQKQSKPAILTQDIKTTSNIDIQQLQDGLEDLKEELQTKLQQQSQEYNKQQQTSALQVKQEIMTQVDLVLERQEKKYLQQIGRLQDMITRYRPSTQVSQDQTSTASNDQVDPLQIHMMLSDVRDQIKQDLEDELQRQQQKLQSQMALDSMKLIKEELKFWSEQVKKDVHYEMNQIGKELKNRISVVEGRIIEVTNEIEFVKQRVDDENWQKQGDRNYENILIGQGGQVDEQRMKDIEDQIKELRRMVDDTLLSLNKQEVCRDKDTKTKITKDTEPLVKKNSIVKIEEKSQLTQQVIISNPVASEVPQMPLQTQNIPVMEKLNTIHEESKLSLEDDSKKLEVQYEVGLINDKLNDIFQTLDKLSLSLDQVSTENIIRLIDQQIQAKVPINDLKNMDAVIQRFRLQIDESIALINDKIRTLDGLEAELERGVKRNARDKTDYMIQMKQIQSAVDKQLKDFKSEIARVASDTHGHNESRNNDAKDSTLEFNDDDEEVFRNAQDKQKALKEAQLVDKSTNSFLPSVSKPGLVQLSTSFKLKKQSLRAQSTELIQNAHDNSQPNIASVANINKYESGRATNLAYSKDKTKSLLNQHASHNYSQLLEPQLMLKLALQKQNQHELDLSMRDNMPQSLRDKKQSLNASSTLQFKHDKVNWENVKIRDTNRATSTLAQHQPMQNLRSEQASPLRLYALVGQTQKEKIQSQRGYKIIERTIQLPQAEFDK